jgi:hypothetical protein
MNGSKVNRGILTLLLFCIIACKPNRVRSKIEEDAYIDSIRSKKDIQAMSRALGETESDRYTDYDFSLQYTRGGAWKVSSFFSLMLKDSTLYSYTKYLDNIVSINMPPTFPQKEGLDSFFYSVTYREHRSEQLDTLIAKLNRVGYWGNSYWGALTPGGDIPCLFVYLKNRGEYRLRVGVSDEDFDMLVLKYIRDTFMQYSPEVDKRLYRLKIRL